MILCFQEVADASLFICSDINCHNIIPTRNLLPNREPYIEPVRLMMFGCYPAVYANMKRLHKLSYAEVNEWSKPMPTASPNEVMVILTKKTRLS